MGSYTLGEPVRLTGTWRVAGVLTDPGTVTAKIKKPDGTELLLTDVSVPPILHPSAGTFTIDVATELEGVWRYRFESPLGPSEGQFSVRSIYSP